MADISPFNAANVIKSLRAGGASRRSISSALGAAASKQKQPTAPDPRASLEKLNLALAASKQEEESKKAARARIAGGDDRFDDAELEFYRKMMEEGGGQSPRVNSIEADEGKEEERKSRKERKAAEKKHARKTIPKDLSATQKAALAARARRDKELGIKDDDDDDSDSSWSDYSDGDDLNFASRRVEKSKVKAAADTAENDANYENITDNINDNAYDDDNDDDYYSRLPQQQLHQQGRQQQISAAQVSDSESDDLDDLFGDDMSSGGDDNAIGVHDSISGGGYGESDDEDDMDNEMMESLKEFGLLESKTPSPPKDDGPSTFSIDDDEVKRIYASRLQSASSTPLNSTSTLTSPPPSSSKQLDFSKSLPSPKKPSAPLPKSPNPNPPPKTSNPQTSDFTFQHKPGQRLRLTRKSSLTRSSKTSEYKSKEPTKFKF
ncbi:hypothetical protein TrVE_jg13574 [Triparma verrucosa]|uniref:Uncharacterized protein n=1 Tax=Triparma verrucosa TaxID=1606542 RepID=A0A9W7EWQ9_9STRA|nr:hypothetical protein TrVE_jg13574 [Triparma verrucosa]